MIPHFVIKCKLCKKEQYTAWHPFWVDKEICYSCRDKMVKKHKGLLDKIRDRLRRKYDD